MTNGHARKRRPHGELKRAMCDFLRTKGSSASISEITAGVHGVVGDAPASSFRSALQDERFFERVERGVFKLRA